MTRDEALKILTIPIPEPNWNRENWLDALVALGLLELDEPKSEPAELAFHIIRNRVGEIAADGIFAAIAGCGLKIVNK